MTVSFYDVPVKQALKQLFDPFEIRTVWLRPDRTVSLTLKKATLWETEAAFRKAIGVGQEQAVTCGDFVWDSRTFRFPPGSITHDVGEVRLVAHVARSSQGAWKGFGVKVRMLFPPGNCPHRILIDRMTVETPEGKTVPFKRTSTRFTRGAKAELSTLPGHANLSDLGYSHFESGTLKEASTVTVRGTARITYPRDLEHREIDLRNLKKPRHLDIAGYRFTVKTAIYTKEKKELKWEQGLTPGKTPERSETFLVWIEDSDGRLLNPQSVLTMDPSQSTASSGSGGSGRDYPAPVTRMVFARIIGEETVTFPFVIKGIPLPKRR